MEQWLINPQSSDGWHVDLELPDGSLDFTVEVTVHGP